MTASVPKPGRGSAGQIRYISSVGYGAPGTFAITVPPSARYAVLTMRGGGGAGGGTVFDEFGSQADGTGGGQGALQRRFIVLTGSAYSITVGQGGVAVLGANGGNGQASAALGVTALGGTGGGLNGVGGGAGGVGDGAEPLAGFGRFQGAAAVGHTGGGPFGGPAGSINVNGNPGSRGSGGGGSGYTTNVPKKGGDGGDGYITIDYFG